MVKTVPIVTRSPCFNDLKNMGYPMILIDDWEEVTINNLGIWSEYYKTIDWKRVRYKLTNSYLEELLQPLSQREPGIEEIGVQTKRFLIESLRWFSSVNMLQICVVLIFHNCQLPGKLFAINCAREVWASLGSLIYSPVRVSGC